MQGQGENTIAVEPSATEVCRDPSPHIGERRGHLQHPVELLLVAFLLPFLVVEVLAAAGRVGSDRLDMPVGMRDIQTFFHAGGMTRSRMRVERGLVGQHITVWVVVGEATPASHPAQSGAAYFAAAQPHLGLPLGVAPSVFDRDRRGINYRCHCIIGARMRNATAYTAAAATINAASTMPAVTRIRRGV